MAKARTTRAPFEIGGATIAAGKRATVDLPMSLLSNHTPMPLPVHVVHGRRDGPRLFVSATVHGDELNGTEIIRRLLRLSRLSRLSGTLIAVPIVNVYGFISYNRYLPDRRDLNRSFPGSTRGSLASQLANLFMREVVERCTHGIDLHTGAIHRTNFPQIRADLSDPETARLARAFAAPLMLNAALRDGSLRQAATQCGVTTLLYEAGEALRLDEFAIRIGVRGIVHMMEALEMLRPSRQSRHPVTPVVARSSYWVRAPASGLLRTPVPSGQIVADGQRLGTITDPFGETEITVNAEDGGVIVGRSNLPVVNQGDGLFHIARVDDADSAQQSVEKFIDEMEPTADTAEPELN